jgi:hypothetical protein
MAAPANLPLWPEFEQAAREHDNDPVEMLTEYMRDCIDTWEAQILDEDIRRDLANSPYTEEDAEEIVRKYRQEKARGAAA